MADGAAKDETQPMNGEARRTIARLASDTVPRLIERLTNSELGELEVREDGWRIRLRRPNGNGLDTTAMSAKPVSDTRTERTTSSRSHTPPRQAAQPPQGMVTSPAVGYFTPRDGVAVGSRVGRGDVLGHVDVLGVRQEVVAPVDGLIGALNVQPGEAIEFGQPVARIDPPEAAIAPVEA